MATITTEFYFSEGTGKGAARYDNKTAVFTNKPSIGGVVYDSIIMDDTKQRYQKTLNGQVLTLTPTEQTAIRTYAEQATAVVPADNTVVKTTPQTLSASEQDQAQSNLGLPQKFNGKYSKTGGAISGEVRLSQKQALIGRPDDTGLIGLYGGSRYADGASLTLNGGNPSANKGTWNLNACSADGTEKSSLGGFPNGSLRLDGKDVEVVESSGQGYIRYKSGLQICSLNITQKLTQTADTLIWFNYPVPFKEIPSVSVTPVIPYGTLFEGTLQYVEKEKCGGFFRHPQELTCGFNFIIVGYWK